MMRCPACGRSYGGPTMAAFGCCPICLADDERIELLVHVEVEEDEPLVALDRLADRRGAAIDRRASAQP